MTTLLAARNKRLAVFLSTRPLSPALKAFIYRCMVDNAFKMAQPITQRNAVSAHQRDFHTAMRMGTC